MISVRSRLVLLLMFPLEVCWSAQELSETHQPDQPELEVIGILLNHDQMLVTVVSNGATELLTGLGQSAGAFEMVAVDSAGKYVDFRTGEILTRVWLRGASIGEEPEGELPPVPNPQFSDRAIIAKIPDPDPLVYRSNRVWNNPCLEIHPHGVNVRNLAEGQNPPVLRPDKLTAVLASLHASAWPCGRVVVIQRPGLYRRRDSAALDKTFEETIALMKQLGVETVIAPTD